MLKWDMELIQVERDFLNFEDLHDALKAYQIQTNTVLNTVDSRTVEAANRRLRLTTQKDPEFDEKFKYILVYKIIFIIIIYYYIKLTYNLDIA